MKKQKNILGGIFHTFFVSNQNQNSGISLKGQNLGRRGALNIKARWEALMRIAVTNRKARTIPRYDNVKHSTKHLRDIKR